MYCCSLHETTMKVHWCLFCFFAFVLFICSCLMFCVRVWFHNCSVLGLLMFVFILFQQGSWNQQWRCFRVYFDFSFRSFHLLLFDVRFWGLISPMLCVMVGDMGFFFWMRKLKPTIKVHSSLFVFFFIFFISACLMLCVGFGFADFVC